MPDISRTTTAETIEQTYVEYLPNGTKRDRYRKLPGKRQKQATQSQKISTKKGPTQKRKAATKNKNNNIRNANKNPYTQKRQQNKTTKKRITKNKTHKKNKTYGTLNSHIQKSNTSK